MGPSSPTNSSPEKEEKKKWKDLKMMKKLERQRAQEEQAKRQEEEEEAAAQSSNQGKPWILGRIAAATLTPNLPPSLAPLPSVPLSFAFSSLSFPSFFSLPLSFFSL